jgi:hypothetical protein
MAEEDQDNGLQILQVLVQSVQEQVVQDIPVLEEMDKLLINQGVPTGT